MKMSLKNIISIITNVIVIVISIWFIMITILVDITIESMLAHFAIALACIANLFPKCIKTKMLLIILAFTLIGVATFIYIYK